MVVPYYIREKAYKYGAIDIVDSWLKNKKFAVYYNYKWIHFGDSRYEDYTNHRNIEKRRKYRLRASKITNQYGEYTYKNKNYANFWAYHLLW
jgi:hypothetical protein